MNEEKAISTHYSVRRIITNLARPLCRLRPIAFACSRTAKRSGFLLRNQTPNQRHQSKSPAISSAMGEYGGVEPRRSRRIAETVPRRKHVSVISVNLVSNLVSLSCTHLHTPHDPPRPTIICIAKYAAASGQKRQAARIGCPPPASFSVM
jgi:hypothetical protein